MKQFKELLLHEALLDNLISTELLHVVCVTIALKFGIPIYSQDFLKRVYSKDGVSFLSTPTPLKESDPFSPFIEKYSYKLEFWPDDTRMLGVGQTVQLELNFESKRGGTNGFSMVLGFIEDFTKITNFRNTF